MNLQQLVLKYKRKKDVDLLVQIIRALRPIIRKKAFTLCSYLPSYDVKDLEQDLVILIMNMLNRYNSKRSKFITYLMIRFRGDPLKILQQVGIRKEETKRKILTDKMLLDTLKDPSNYQDIISDVVVRKEVLTLLDTVEERKIFDMLYTFQIPVRLIAKKIKKSQKETSKIIKVIRNNPQIIKICKGVS